MSEQLTRSEQLLSLYRTTKFRTGFTLSIICLSFFAAIFEAIGLSFVLPIIELSQEGSPSQSSSNAVDGFIYVYQLTGIPFTLESVVIGASVILTVRYTASFLVSWLGAKLRTRYTEYLQTQAYTNALDAEISYFDEQGSDNILNVIVTQSKYGGKVIKHFVDVVQQGLITLMYLSISLYIAPILTIGAGILLGGLTLLFRHVLESGDTVGGRVAQANEDVQGAVQAGMQGIRDVKLFGMTDELLGNFRDSVERAVEYNILVKRNAAALNNFYQLVTAITIFILTYAALEFLSLSLTGLGVFLFAMFRLAPRLSSLNNTVYSLESSLPHLVRTQDFIDELIRRNELENGSASPPGVVDDIEFDEVEFSYDGDEIVLDGLSFSIESGEFVGFVGPSGAGKSTIVSLLTRMHEPTGGEIRANGTPIDQFDITEWREHVSVVRQNPFIFNDTLRRNITIGKRDASQSEIERVCAVAQVTEFFDDLPNGYDTVLGDDGVRLSGGQKQRVALARALLNDADLLVLDEATSDLDSNIEETVHQAIESMDRDYAMLVIAHRLSTVVNADCIYTMENGTITEAGTHRTLLEQDSLYADLYSTQTQAM